MKIVEYTGLMTLILMLSMHINSTLKIGILIQVVSTLFLISPFLEKWLNKQKEQGE